MRVADKGRREVYEREAGVSGWSVRQLDRQISSLYYERHLTTQNEHHAEIEAAVVERNPRMTADDLVKDPYVFEVASGE